jgi:hypothetical protein
MRAVRPDATGPTYSTAARSWTPWRSIAGTMSRWAGRTGTKHARPSSRGTVRVRDDLIHRPRGAGPGGGRGAAVSGGVEDATRSGWLQVVRMPFIA